MTNHVDATVRLEDSIARYLFEAATQPFQYKALNNIIIFGIPDPTWDFALKHCVASVIDDCRRHAENIMALVRKEIEP